MLTRAEIEALQSGEFLTGLQDVAANSTALLTSAIDTSVTESLVMIQEAARVSRYRVVLRLSGAPANDLPVFLTKYFSSKFVLDTSADARTSWFNDVLTHAETFRSEIVRVTKFADSAVVLSSIPAEFRCAIVIDWQ